MYNTETGNSNVHLAEGVYRKIAYTQEFRQIVHEHPGVLKTALILAHLAEDAYNPPNMQLGAAELQWNQEKTEFEIIKERGETVGEPASFLGYMNGRGCILSPGETFREGDLEVTVLGRSKRVFITSGFGGGTPGEVKRVDNSSYLKVKLGNRAYFVKKSTQTTDPGFKEFKDTIQARGVLAEVYDLQVVDAKLGYSDDHQSWFVSRWEDLESTGFFPYISFTYNAPNDYGVFTPGRTLADKRPLKEQAIQRAQAVIKNINTRLAEVGMELTDISANLFYNPQTDKFFLLDITTSDPRRGIGQS